MAVFDPIKFTTALAGSAEFTAAQVDALASALQASLDEVIVPGESLEAPPLRGAGADLS